ncbi:hypothetical protein [Clostridium sp.]|uniref:hypothetical protein n=1 Tax=Clostridium sp. TaxID=1506 RepID=UPI001A55CFF7|nr:hypothetical protein [Clostridium sp.]MBK5241061.1 hypothetical protein [Clostridium sp.]
MKSKMNKTIIIGIVIIVIAVGGYAGYTKFFNTSNQVDSTGVKSKLNQRDPAVMTTAYSAVLNELVTEKTITQAQSDKVLSAVTENMQGGGGSLPVDEQKPTGSGSVDKQNPNDATQTDRANPKNDRLSELVTSEVITQLQADTINQKLQDAMKITQSTTTK